MKDNWKIVHPPIFIQSPDYSNIENEETDNKNFFI